ncbi:MAG: cation transporting ATPase C-terminal domain-containing protein, partial [Patescibacteria group bacterium]
EADDIVLLQKSLHVIIDVIKEGRLVFANTVKYIKATMTSNFGNFYAVAVASLLVDFLPMLPVQLLLLNLLSDFPMMAIASDTVDASEIAEPHSYNLRDITLFTVLIGVVSTVFDFIFFGLFYRQGAQVLQTNWFIASILTELVFLFSVRTKLPLWRAKAPSLIIMLLTASAAIVTIILPFIPISQSWFGFTTPKIATLGLIFGIVLVYLVVTEFAKLSYYKYFNKDKSVGKLNSHHHLA